MLKWGTREHPASVNSSQDLWQLDIQTLVGGGIAVDRVSPERATPEMEAIT